MWKFIILAASCLLVANCHVVKRQAHPCPDDCANKPLDISLIMDSSASIWPGNFTRGLWFLENFAKQFQIGPDEVRVSMVTYGDRVYKEDAFGYDDYTEKESLEDAIGKMPHRGGRTTETGEAIRYLLDEVIPTSRDGVRKVVIVLTDGNSQRPDVTKAEAKKALELGLEVFSIGIGNDISSDELHNIATDGEHVFNVVDYEALPDIMRRLTYETCGVLPQPVCGYSPVDVSFVIDSSTSIGRSNFGLELEFIKSFLKDFEINPSSTRVAAIMFGDRVYTESVVPFDKFNNKKETMDAILGLKWMAGRSTGTGEGINYMIENFKPHFRSSAAHIGIIITDGESTRPRSTIAAAKEARENGIITVAVGVGNLNEKDYMDELEVIAGDPSRVIKASDFDQLNTVLEQLTNVTCHGVRASLQAKHNQ